MKNCPPPLQHPPYTNRGVLDTKTGLEVLIDWFAFTLPFEDPEIVISLLGLSIKDDFNELAKGGMGYKGQYRYGNIAVLYDGKEGMGTHVEMSGKGCREYEARFNNSWQSLISKVFNNGGHMTRMDVAIDDFEGYLDLAEIEEKVKQRNLRSRHREARVITKYDLTSNRFYNHPVFGRMQKPEGKTVYLGTSQSDTQIRFYNKSAEQNADPNIHWIRVETQCRDERACVLARHILESGDLGAVISGVLYNYLTFVEPSEDSNRSRWPECAWWSRFIGTVEKLKLSVRKAERTVEQIKYWFAKQMAPTLALIFKYEQGDFTFFDDMLKSGEQRLKKRYLVLSGAA